MKRVIALYLDKIYELSSEEFVEIEDRVLCENNEDIITLSLLPTVVLNELNEPIKDLIKTITEAEAFKELHEYEKASIKYEDAAEICSEMGDTAKYKDYYAYAAIMKENTEKWRYISSLWYKASGKFDKNTMDYRDYNSLIHSYPTISFDKWNNWNEKEKVARACQYAAYSEDNYNGPTDSYWLYKEAYDSYREAQNYGRMIECLISATNRYIKGYSKLPEDIINEWKDILCKEELVSQNRYIIELSFEEIYRTMERYDNENAKFFYIESQKLRIKDYEDKNETLRVICLKTLWCLTDFNTNVAKITLLTISMVLIFFPFTYCLADNSIMVTDAIFKSINTFLGIETIVTEYNALYVLSVLEVLFSYFILVIISTFVIEKVVKSLD